MSTAIAKVSPTSISQGSFTEEQVELIKRTICKGASNDELGLFMATCRRLGLDPFARQIFAVKRKDRKTNTEVMSIQVSIDGFRLVAERTGCYAPGRMTEFEYNDKNELIRAVAYVKKHSHGEWHEVPEEATWGEFAQSSPMWDRMPRVMLAKCAEARALRRAFPAELGGVYAPEEMDQAEAPPAIAFQAPAQAVVVVEDSSIAEKLAQRIIEAESLHVLEAVGAECGKLPKGSKERTTLRELYKSKKDQIERLLLAQKEADDIPFGEDEEVAS